MHSIKHFQGFEERNENSRGNIMWNSIRKVKLISLIKTHSKMKENEKNAESRKMLKNQMIVSKSLVNQRRVLIRY